MKFIADFHIHSHYSLATSGQLTPEYLDHWGRIKGIQVIGTGDFTHPGWTAELEEKLEPTEPGLFRLKKDLRIQGGLTVPVDGTNGVRFMLTAEISNIYKKAGRTRKVHNVIFAPDFETVKKIQETLARNGFNITSDGRPILGLDSRDLLELCLEASPDIFFVPAHIWTPWFSALGSKSGFDTIEECYGDLSGHIYAVETGLSSDPAMNRLCSFLDRYALISNSDAHSPEKLGREGNLFNTEMSYESILKALKENSGNGFLGTIEFFPQEGKYHHDGHRKCGISWEPEETLKHQGVCPVCGKQVTIGVMYRVMELADRKEFAEYTGLPYYSLIPLKEILSEMLNVGPHSQQIGRAYDALIRKLGSEFDILLNLPVDQIQSSGNELLAEGIRRMRDREVILEAGYDGEYGVIRVFGDEIKNGFGLQKALFEDLVTETPPKLEPKNTITGHSRKKRKMTDPAMPESPRGWMPNPGQEEAIQHGPGPVLILAGPGTGKTGVLTRRLIRLIEKGTDPDSVLAVTFTNKAAREIQDRLEHILSPDKTAFPTVCTFHALGYEILKQNIEHFGRQPGFNVIDPEQEEGLLRDINMAAGERKNWMNAFSRFKQYGRKEDLPEPDGDSRFQRYESLLAHNNLFDLDDLIVKPLELFRSDPEICRFYRQKFKWIFVDEYQDINEAQYHLIRLIAPGRDANLCVIGDPNQAIYGFRGADVRYIRCFQQDYPGAKVYSLSVSYRCPKMVLNASSGILKNSPPVSLSARRDGVKIGIIKNGTDKSEAEFVARTIETLMGGLRFFSMDSGITDGASDPETGLSDFAVLCRTGRQMPVIEKAFQDHSIPYQTAEERPFFKLKSVRMILDVLKASEQPENEWLGRRIGEPDLMDMAFLRSIRTCLPVREKLALIEQKFPDSRSGMSPELWKRLKGFFEPFGTDLAGMLKTSILGMPADGLLKSERVSLMTLHAAKGLEFSVVFIVGCEDGLLPYHLWDRESDPDEERRLLYVGMTRAGDRLFLTHAEKRVLMGKSLTLKRSPFLDDIEKEWIDMGRSRVRSRHKTKDSQLGLF